VAIFDHKRTRHTRENGGNSASLEDLDSLQDEVPEVEDTIAEIERLLARRFDPGCGCFG
jgi:hypothetical protein